MKIDRGTVLLVSLDPTVGHEQRGTWPCIVVSDPIVTNDQRFPMVAVIPLTGTPGEGSLQSLHAPGSLRTSQTFMGSDRPTPFD